MQENLYNMNETGVLLSVLGSLRYFINAEMQKAYELEENVD
jgi:hypothetical protein